MRLIIIAHAPQHGEAIHPRHQQVQQHDIRAFGLMQLQGLRATVGFQRGIPPAPEHRHNQLKDAAVIINHQNLLTRH